jgi:hypothetical protein
MQQDQPAGDSDPYDFFMNPGSPQRQSKFSGIRPSNTILIGISAGIVLVLGLIILAIIGSGGGKEPAVTAVAQDQSELAHLAGIAIQNANASQQPAQNVAQTIGLSAASAQTQLVQTLAKGGTNLGGKTLALKQSATVDNQLNGALNSSTFDATFLGVMQTQLNTYATDLQYAYQAAKSDAVRQVLTNEYNDSKLLMQQLNTAQGQI